MADYPDACVAGPAPGKDEVVAPVVIVAYNRPQYLNRSLYSVREHWTKPGVALKFPLFVSVDGHSEEVRQVVLEHSKGFQGAIKLVQHTPENHPNGYQRLAHHYRYLFKFFLECLKYPRMIFLEDDLDIGVDFFDYFEAMVPLLQSEKQLWCISAWNDHAVTKAYHDPKRLYRSDFMPGLGWMTRNDSGIDLMKRWPEVNWDDWMRMKINRGNKQCVFPERPRTFTFGRDGTSQGMFYDQYLSKMAANPDPVDWKTQDLTYLKDSNYPGHFQREACAAQPLAATAPLPASGDWRVTYGSELEYRLFMNRLGTLSEWREGIPRMAIQEYHVVVMHDKARIFVVHASFLKCPANGGTAAAAGATAPGHASWLLRRFRSRSAAHRARRRLAGRQQQ